MMVTDTWPCLAIAQWLVDKSRCDHYVVRQQRAMDYKQKDEQKMKGWMLKNGKERLQPRLQAELRTLSAAGSVEPCS